MKIKHSSIIYTFFFFSGAAGLIYEIVWGRMLVVIFGNTTNSMVAVISAFLSGLALGSVLFSRFSNHQSKKNLLRTYSLLEMGVGLSALSTLLLFPLIEPIYSNVSDGSSVTFLLILVKFCMTFAILIVPTFLMGATLPVLIDFIKSYYPDLGKNISMLYAVNTFGAVFGTALSAFLLIELAGLRGTLYIAVMINILIAVGSFIIKPRENLSLVEVKEDISDNNIDQDSQDVKRWLIFLVIGISGLISIAYQILWTRILTPAVGTFIYAFAGILIIYLLGIALGSLFYNKYLNAEKRSYLIFSVSEFFIGFFALFSVFVSSLYFRELLENLVLFRKIIVIPILLPAAFFMGVSFPAAIDALGESKNHGRVVGLVYFFNTIGSILGGFLASFFFIPFIGSTQSVLLLAGFNFLLAILLVVGSRAKLFKEKVTKIIFNFSIILFFVCVSLFYLKGDQLYEANAQKLIEGAKSLGLVYSFQEDETGSVFASNDPSKYNSAQLIVDGIGMTSKDLETKLMAHVPIAIHQNPKDMLVVALGMGTTFRSAIKHDLNVDAIELSRSVANSFPIFYPDASDILRQSNAKIIINDGRNYAVLTDKNYDIITIDPPPPFNSAGTTVLYSENFYRDLVKRLRVDGLVNQWIYFNSNEDDIAMAMNSFLKVFPYVTVYYSPKDTVLGVNLLGSLSPINIDDSRIEKIFSSEIVKKDLAEVGSIIEPSKVRSIIIANQNDLLSYLNNFSTITDDRPSTEYFINRYAKGGYQYMTIELFKERIGKK